MRSATWLSDHNQIIMETLKRVAEQHGLQCLLHEKPFAGVNGSGKHNNWSLTTDDGINLLEPGKTPHENIQFLLVLCCILRAVDRHADLLRESAADVGNDHRLGANEAPPAIISVFLGEQLGDVLRQLVNTGSRSSQLKGRPSSHRCKDPSRGLPRTPQTGTVLHPLPSPETNSSSVWWVPGIPWQSANVVLNTIVAEAFSDACDILEKAEDFDLAVHDLIKEYATLHQRIVFNGNGYSEEWVKEAERRGLPNIQSMVDAIPALVTEESVRMFEKFGVFTKAELNSRAEIQYEGYAKAINIEARAMIDIASKHIIPAVMRYAKNLAETANEIREAGADDSVPVEILKRLTALLSEARKALLVLKDVTRTANSLEAGEKQAHYYHDEVCTAMAALRLPVDELEMIVDKEEWPMPSYGDLLFEV